MPLTLLAGNENPALLYTPEVTISRFGASARASDGLVQIQWQTTLEQGVDAFFVQRQRNGGAPEPIGPGYVRTHGNEDGESYELADPLVQAGDIVRYDLFIASRHGQNQQVATWTGVIRTAASLPKSLMTTSASSSAPAVPLALAQPWIGAVARVLAWTNSAPADRVRLSLREEGIYRVSAQELADASGWDLASVTSAIASTNLSMSCQGVPVAWYADGTNMLFHGVPTASRFAPENVYWVSQGPGSHMARQVMTPELPATTNQWFFNQIVRQGTSYLGRASFNSCSTLADAPAPYLAFLPGWLGAGEILPTQSETLTDYAPGAWTGSVTVNLMSLYEFTGAHSHTARISIGSASLGEPSWPDEQYISRTYPFSTNNLSGGVAALKITNIATGPPAPATDYTRFLCISYGLSYACLYRAHNGALRCTGGTGNTVSVSGFASNDVVVLNVTATNAPVVVEPVTIVFDVASNNWSAAFSCGGSGQVYQVFSKSAGTRQPSVRGVRDVDWSSPTNAADYVILVPPEGWCDGFRQAMQPLADYRNAQGLRTRIVDVESLYNRYSYGLVDPFAIQTFCRDGYTNWSTHPLRYVLLAGAGALDFKYQRFSVNDYTACLIPTMIAGQSFTTGEGLTVAIDAKFGDVNDDNEPEVAIGRMPTTKTQDLSVIVQKTIAYEGGRFWKQPISLSADWDNVVPLYYPFSTGTDRLLEPLSRTGRSLVKHYPINNTDSMAIVKTVSLLPALSNGASLFHFFGHTGSSSFGGSSRLLQKTDITSANWQKPPIMVVMGCNPNCWQSLTTTVYILPYGLFAANTGFVACLGATGYMLASEEETFALKLYADEGAPGTRRLGDIWRRGLQRMHDVIPPERFLCYSLIGDPTLVFFNTPPLTIIFR